MRQLQARGEQLPPSHQELPRWAKMTRHARYAAIMDAKVAMAVAAASGNQAAAAGRAGAAPGAPGAQPLYGWDILSRVRARETMVKEPAPVKRAENVFEKIFGR